MSAEDPPLTSDEDLRRVRIGEVVPHNDVIALAEPDPAWPEHYAREAARVRTVLGDRVLRLEHVGSTSVPGLLAKPIIDMMLVVADTACETSYVPDLEAAGYVLRLREPDWFEHRLFKGPDTDINLHVFSSGAAEIEAMIGFRDRLRISEDDRDRYARVKGELARRTWRHVQHYADAKSAVVQEIMSRVRGT